MNASPKPLLSIFWYLSNCSFLIFNNSFLFISDNTDLMVWFLLSAVDFFNCANAFFVISFSSLFFAAVFRGLHCLISSDGFWKSGSSEDFFTQASASASFCASSHSWSLSSVAIVSIVSYFAYKMITSILCFHIYPFIYQFFCDRKMLSHNFPTNLLSCTKINMSINLLHHS